MAKVIITNKGAAMKTNHWKCGEVVDCHPNLAEYFISKGIAESIDAPQTEVVEAEKKPKKKK